MVAYSVLNSIRNLAILTFKGGLRTKVFITLVVLSVFASLIIIPSFASFSMRQVREVATSLSLSMISFVLLVLSLFLGIHLIYRDIEQRITYFTLSLPISREVYLLGKFAGICLILIFSGAILTAFSSLTLLISDRLYGADLPVIWENYFASVLMEIIKTILILAFLMLFSSFSTNVFLPLFGTIGIYIIGNVSQSVYDYIQTAYAKKLPYITVLMTKVVYYLLPNLSLYDYKFYAVYNLKISVGNLFIAMVYWILSMAISLSLALLVFRKREML